MPKHACKDTVRLAKLLTEQGCKISEKGQKMLIYHPDGETILTVHVGGHGRSYHPMRRWAQNKGLKVK